MSAHPIHQKWEARAAFSWRDMSLAELWQYRYLVWSMAWKNYISLHRQTLLGITWVLLKPLLMVFVYLLLFQKILNISTGNMPPFLLFLTGNTMWSLFSDTFSRTSSSISANAALWNKVYFPRLVSPLSDAVYALLMFSGQFIIMLLAAVVYAWAGKTQLSVLSLSALLPALLMCTCMGFGAGLIMSLLTARYRDFSILAQIGMRVLFFVSPVLYAVSKIPEPWAWVAALNPLTGIFELTRFAVSGTACPPWPMLLLSGTVSVLLLAAGVYWFQRKADALFEEA